MKLLIDKGMAKAWQDAEFKSKLMADPKSVLKENGVELPEGLDVKIVENTSNCINLILPMPPKEGELTDEELEKVQGGTEVHVEYCNPISKPDQQ